MFKQTNKVKIRLYTVDDTGQTEQLVNQISGTKLIHAREMTRTERRENSKITAMPVVLEFDDGSKIYAFIPGLHFGNVASINQITNPAGLS